MCVLFKTQSLQHFTLLSGTSYLLATSLNYGPSCYYNNHIAFEATLVKSHCGSAPKDYSTSAEKPRARELKDKAPAIFKSQKYTNNQIFSWGRGSIYDI